KACRRSAPLRGVGTLPAATLTSAAHSRVHRLPGLPKSRGLRCKSARSRSAASGPKTKRVRWAREDGFCKHASPVALKACSASSTVWSSMPRYVAMRGARSPRALANRIWQRRKTKASLERRPCSSTSRSSSVSVRTKIGGPLSSSVPHLRFPILEWHEVVEGPARTARGICWSMIRAPPHCARVWGAMLHYWGALAPREETTDGARAYAAAGLVHAPDRQRACGRGPGSGDALGRLAQQPATCACRGLSRVARRRCAEYLPLLAAQPVARTRPHDVLRR